jgi:hypothetical protein
MPSSIGRLIDRANENPLRMQIGSSSDRALSITDVGECVTRGDCPSAPPDLVPSDIAPFAVISDGWSPMDSIGVLKSDLGRPALREKDLALPLRRMENSSFFRQEQRDNSLSFQ